MECPNCGAAVSGADQCWKCAAPLITDCPKCGLTNPPGTEQCDCGFRFVERPKSVEIYLSDARLSAGASAKSSCSECGREIQSSWVACPSCGAWVGRSCPNCGQELESGWIACPACGTKPGVSKAAGAKTGSTTGIAAVILGACSIVMPYFAAVFLVPAAFVCGFIAFNRGQKGLGSVGAILATLGLVGIIYVSQQLNQTLGDSLGSSPPLGRSGTAALPVVVTLAEYNAIQDGMTYEQTARIIGASGEELSRSEIAGFTTVMYSWSNRGGSNMNAMFQNGRLVSKAQFGLK